MLPQENCQIFSKTLSFMKWFRLKNKVEKPNTPTISRIVKTRIIEWNQMKKLNESTSTLIERKQLWVTYKPYFLNYHRKAEIDWLQIKMVKMEKYFLKENGIVCTVNWYIRSAVENNDSDYWWETITDWLRLILTICQLILNNS